MWQAKFEVQHDSCIISPLCRKYNVTDSVYLVNAWIDKNDFFYSEAHILQGREQDKKKFIKDLKKQDSIIKIEIQKNFIITLEKKPAWMSVYMPLWDKRLIQIKPVIQKSDGKETWEMASWSKEPLMEILNRMPDEFKIKLISIKETKISEIFMPQIMPNLTERQKQTIQIALSNGYYDFPRKFNLDDLAKKLQISKPTAQQHLRCAEKKVLQILVDK